jgi:hypothetical protein
MLHWVCLCWWLRERNCDKKTGHSADNIMEGQKEEKAVITMVSDPALTLFGFFKFLIDCIRKFIFTMKSKLSSISEKFKVYRIDSSKNIVHSFLLRFITSFAEILSDYNYGFWSNSNCWHNFVIHYHHEYQYNETTHDQPNTLHTYTKVIYFYSNVIQLILRHWESHQ